MGRRSTHISPELDNLMNPRKVQEEDVDISTYDAGVCPVSLDSVPLYAAASQRLGDSTRLRALYC